MNSEFRRTSLGENFSIADSPERRGVDDDGAWGQFGRRQEAASRRRPAQRRRLVDCRLNERATGVEHQDRDPRLLFADLRDDILDRNAVLCDLVVLVVGNQARHLEANDVVVAPVDRRQLVARETEQAAHAPQQEVVGIVRLEPDAVPRVVEEYDVALFDCREECVELLVEIRLRSEIQGR